MKREASCSISRRSAIAGVGAAAVATALPLNAWASETPIDQWDVEADVVVIGSGLGVYGALKAASLGARVVILEKLFWGGSAGQAEGAHWIPTNPIPRPTGYEDTPEEALAYMKAISEGADESRIRSFLDNGGEFVSWTIDELGFAWTPAPFPAGAYYDVEGAKSSGRGIRVADEFSGIDKTFAKRAPFNWEYLRTKCDDLCVEVMMDTRAEHLVQDENGAVVGVIASTPDGEMRISAKKGVLMAAGGFDHNPQMRKAYWKMPAYNTLILPHATGDAIVMGQEVGAALEGMAHYMTCQFWCPDWDDSMKWDIDSFEQNPDYFAYNGWQGKPGAILVNRKGRRFCNEAAAYGTFPRVWDSYDAGTYEHCPDIPAYFICDSKPVEPYGVHKDFFTQADTLEELAEKLGIDVEGFMAEIEHFNANAAQGIDPDFTRGEHACEVCWGDFMGIMGDIPNPNLAPLDTPPFYGCVMVPGTNGCNGGLCIDANAQVLDTNGRPIPGFYACGTAAAHVGGPSYAAGGVSLGSGAVMGYVAAKAIMGV